MTNGKEGFKVDKKRLTLVMNTVWEAVKNKRGIFKDGLKPFLPQWNLPAEFEYNPQRTELNNPKDAAKLLFTRTFIDKLSVSSHLQRKVLETWNDDNKKWIFFPENIVTHNETEINLALKNNFSYNLPVSASRSIGHAYLNNYRVLIEHYDSDPRNLVRYKTVEQARDNIMKLEGFGTGLANLLLMEYSSRKIALPLDFLNLKPKIDRHKARIPFNTNAITLLNHWRNRGEIHGDAVVYSLEEAYLEVAQSEGLSLLEIDSALWIIGSEICYRSEISACLKNCPLSSGICQANTVLNHERGYYKVYNSDGTRYDSREKKNQPILKLTSQLI